MRTIFLSVNEGSRKSHRTKKGIAGKKGDSELEVGGILKKAREPYVGSFYDHFVSG